MSRSSSSRLKEKIARGVFVVTAELTPQLTSNPDDVLAQAAPLADKVDAINITDGAGARVAISSLAACAILARSGVEPIMQMTCRDRNRIAIASDLIGAGALGIRNLLMLTGDDPKTGDEPEAMPVFDLASRDVIALARQMSDDGTVTSGRKIKSAPNFFVGAADVPFDPPKDWQPDALIDKIKAGAQFVQTQFCFEPAVVRRYFDVLEDFGILEKLSFLVGIGPIVSARSAAWMNENLWGVSIPEAIIKRLSGAEDQAAEGLAIAAELLQSYREMPGVSGVHIMAPAQSSDRVAEVIERAGS